MSRIDEMPKTPRKSVNWDTMDIEDCATSYAKAHPKPKESPIQEHQFILKIVGFAMGAGNVWRFPSLAYEHGGGAFLVAYMICSLFCGLPMMYFEVFLGQFLQAAPTTMFYRVMPALQGLGWTMCGVTFLVCVYYNVVLSWMGIYFFGLLSGQSSQWLSCENLWNDEYCIDIMSSMECSKNLSSKSLFVNGTCTSKIVRTQPFISATEQYFENYLLQRSDNMNDWSDLNVQLLFTLVFLWCSVVICLFVNEKFMETAVWITGIFPFFIIGLCLRAVSLPGAEWGLKFFFQNGMQNIFDYKTWTAAFSQALFSLSIGFGTLITVSSANRNDHNCQRDVTFIFILSTITSVLGGTIVFATLGYMANVMGLEVHELLHSGTYASFVAYPEVFGTLPFAPAWAFVFFGTLILLGIITQIAFVRTIAACVISQFSLGREWKPKTEFLVCAAALGFGWIMCTKGGIYYFELFDTFSISFSLPFVILTQVFLIVICYGIKHHLSDIRTQFVGPTTILEKVFGASGYFYIFNWIIAVPAISGGVLICGCFSEFSKFEFGRDHFRYPKWADYLGRGLAVGPLLFIPLIFTTNAIQFLLRGRSLSELFRVQPGHCSYWKKRGRGTPKMNADVSNKKSFIAF